MKLLIAYAGKTGSAAEMAALLAKHIPNHELTVCNLAESAPDPAAFDYVVLGASIRYNRVQKPLRAYIDAHREVLCAMPHTLFLCCAFPDQLEHYFAVAFPRELRESAESMEYFGGDLSLSRQRGIDKIITRMLRNSILEGEEDGLVLPTLLPEHVRLLADRLRKK